MESALQHICDEPLPEMAKTYRAVSAMVRKYLPSARILEAVFHEEAVKALRGAIDIWIPISDTYQKMQDVFAQYCGKDDEIWFYTCLDPFRQMAEPNAGYGTSPCPSVALRQLSI